MSGRQVQILSFVIAFVGAGLVGMLVLIATMSSDLAGGATIIALFVIYYTAKNLLERTPGVQAAKQQIAQEVRQKVGAAPAGDIPGLGKNPSQADLELYEQLVPFIPDGETVQGYALGRNRERTWWPPFFVVLITDKSLLLLASSMNFKPKQGQPPLVIPRSTPIKYERKKFAGQALHKIQWTDPATGKGHKFSFHQASPSATSYKRAKDASYLESVLAAMRH